MHVLRRNTVYCSLILTVVLGTSGCKSVSRGSRASFTWSANKYANDPVSRIPYFIGGGIGGIVASPLDLISWPLTYGLLTSDENDDGKESDSGLRFWGSIAPSSYLGSALGTILGAPFHVISQLFRSDDSEVSEQPDQSPPDQQTPPGPEASPEQSPETDDWGSDDWNQDDAWDTDDGAAFEAGPPGGDRPPVPGLWNASSQDSKLSRPAALQSEFIFPWQSYRPVQPNQ